MSIFVRIGERGGAQSSDRPGPDLGEYVYSKNLPDCPIRIMSFLDPAPNEDIPPAEVLSWIPLMRMIVQVLVQINREITTVNKVILYDRSAISDDVISVVQSCTPGATVFAPVDVDDAARGVNATMRPVEQNSVLNEYLASLQTYLALFDDVTGVGPIDRGVPANPRKSATEATSIVAASNRRNRDRLEIMANLWSEMARVQHAYQREVFGEAIQIPLPSGLSHTIPVPDPLSAAFSFRVDAVDLGHLSRRGELDTYFNWVTTLTNVLGTFRGNMPRMVREALRKMGKAMGVEDVDLFLEAPTLEAGPEDRYIAHLQTGAPIPVDPTDQHEMYMAYYTRILQKALEQGQAGASVGELKQAIERHNIFVRQAATAGMEGVQGSPIPGVSQDNQVDNQIAAAMNAGLAPPASPQTLRG